MFARLFGGGTINFGSEATKLTNTLDDCAKTFQSIKNSKNLANATTKYNSAKSKLDEVSKRIKFLQSKFKSIVESKKAPRDSLPNSARDYINTNGNSFKVQRTPTIRNMETIIRNFNSSRSNYNTRKAADDKRAAENKARNNAVKAVENKAAKEIAEQKAAENKARINAAKAAAEQRDNAVKLEQIKKAAVGMGDSVNALKRQVNINKIIQSTLGTSGNLNLANLQRRVNQSN
jgi:murein L,D-transpeptidase YcbB/YkuD